MTYLNNPIFQRSIKHICHLCHICHILNTYVTHITIIIDCLFELNIFSIISV